MHDHDEYLKPLRDLQEVLSQPAISLLAVQAALKLLVMDAIDMRERMKKAEAGKGE